MNKYNFLNKILYETGLKIFVYRQTEFKYLFAVALEYDCWDEGGFCMWTQKIGHLFQNYPDQFKDEFILEIESTNYRRAKFVSFTLVFISMAMCFNCGIGW